MVWRISVWAISVTLASDSFCVRTIPSVRASKASRDVGNSTNPLRAIGVSLRLKTFHLLSSGEKRSVKPPMDSEEPRKRNPPGERE